MSANGKDYDGPILECKNLSISYFTRAGEIPAVIDFNLTLHQGQSAGLVGAGTIAGTAMPAATAAWSISRNAPVADTMHATMPPAPDLCCRC